MSEGAVHCPYSSGPSFAQIDNYKAEHNLKCTVSSVTCASKTSLDLFHRCKNSRVKFYVSQLRGDCVWKYICQRMA